MKVAFHVLGDVATELFVRSFELHFGKQSRVARDDQVRGRTHVVNNNVTLFMILLNSDDDGEHTCVLAVAIRTNQA